MNELQDGKREMEEKLNHPMIQTKSYAESVQNTSQVKNQTSNGKKRKRRNSIGRTLLSMLLKNLLVTTRMMLLNLTMST